MGVKLSVKEIKQVTSKCSDRNGYYREVWFAGDLVIKADDPSTTDYDDAGANDAEWENYKRLCRRKPKFKVDGKMCYIKFPKMTRIKGYIVAERLRFKHLPENGVECGCSGKWDHSKKCPVNQIIEAVEKAAEELGLEDMHTGNFQWDEKTNTAWLLDLGL